LSTKKIELAR